MIIVLIFKISPHCNHLPHNVMLLCLCIFLSKASVHTSFGVKGGPASTALFYFLYLAKKKIIIEVNANPFWEKLICNLVLQGL